MNEIEFDLTGKSVIRLKHKQGDTTSSHVRTDFNLNVSENVPRENFLNEKDLPTAAGVKALTQCFVQGLIGNVHYADASGFWNKEEHMKYILDELERAKHMVSNLSESKFNS